MGSSFTYKPCINYHVTVYSIKSIFLDQLAFNTVACPDEPGLNLNCVFFTVHLHHFQMNKLTMNNSFLYVLNCTSQNVTNSGFQTLHNEGRF